MDNVTKHYSNGEITVVWKSGLCQHSANCVKGLPGVFNSKQNPWINVTGTETEMIKQQVEKCPSGALSFEIKQQ